MHERKVRIIAVTAAIALLTMTALTAAQRERRDEVSIAGSWTLSASGGPHPITIRLVLEQDATNVTGTLENPHGGSDFQVTGKFVGRKLTLTGADGTDLELAGELKDDGTMAGMLSSTRGDLPWIAKRVSSK